MKGRDAARESVRDWINDVMEKTGLSAGKLAKRTGVSPSTIYRALDKDSSFLMTVTTLTKLSQETGIPLPANLLSDQPEANHIQGEMAELEPIREAEGTLALSSNSQTAWRVSTRSLDLEGYLPGDIVISDETIRPRPGDIVCARNFNFGRGRDEMVLRLYDPPYLLSRSHIRDGKPILIGTERTVVIGTVVRLIRERNAA